MRSRQRVQEKISICTWGGASTLDSKDLPHISSHIWISDLKQISITTGRIRPKVKMFFFFKGNFSQTLRIIFFYSFHQFPRALPNIFRCVGTIGSFYTQSQCFTSSLNNTDRSHFCIKPRKRQNPKNGQKAKEITRNFIKSNTHFIRTDRVPDPNFPESNLLENCVHWNGPTFSPALILVLTV